jgi:glycosyltransferase involved in cell wall biosynthesis
MRLTPPHLLHVFPNFVPGGQELRTVHLIAALGDSFRHSILSLDGRTEAAARLPAGAPVRLLPSPPRAGSLATVGRLRRLLQSETPDLLLTYGWGAFDTLLAALSLGYRRILHHEDGFDDSEAHCPKRRRVLARRFTLPYTCGVVVPSRQLAALAAGLWRVPPERILYVPNGVHIGDYPPADGNPDLRRELGIPPRAFVVGACSHLRPVKNFLRLLEASAGAVASLDLHVLLVGDGTERAALEARAAGADLAGRVHLAGYQAAPAHFYRAMDLFALTSDSEQMPLCLLEAMACGLPVVATDVGDVRAMLPAEQSRFLVPLDAAACRDLCARLLEMAADPGLRRRLGAANRRRVESTYTFTATAATYRSLYQAAMA